VELSIVKKCLYMFGDGEQELCWLEVVTVMSRVCCHICDLGLLTLMTVITSHATQRVSQAPRERSPRPPYLAYRFAAVLSGGMSAY